MGKSVREKNHKEKNRKAPNDIAMKCQHLFALHKPGGPDGHAWPEQTHTEAHGKNNLNLVLFIIQCGCHKSAVVFCTFPVVGLRVVGCFVCSVSRPCLTLRCGFLIAVNTFVSEMLLGNIIVLLFLGAARLFRRVLHYIQLMGSFRTTHVSATLAPAKLQLHI